VRRASGRWRRRLGLTHGNLGVLRHPAAVWLLSVGVIWFWHAAAPYDATLATEPLHLLEHASFLVTAVLFWQVVVGVRGAARVSNGLGVLLVFAMAMQSVFPLVLLIFARTPWYSGYATTTAPWAWTRSPTSSWPGSSCGSQPAGSTSRRRWSSWSPGSERPNARRSCSKRQGEFDAANLAGG
jgi:cytochrome c oxidase assembly factor CtaG